jgi:hypothetical protein
LFGVHSFLTKYPKGINDLEFGYHEDTFNREWMSAKRFWDLSFSARSQAKVIARSWFLPDSERIHGTDDTVIPGGELGYGGTIVGTGLGFQK